MRRQARGAWNFKRTEGTLASDSVRVLSSASSRIAAAAAGLRQSGVLRAKRARRDCRPSADRLICRNQMLLAVADQIRAPHSLQRITQQRPILRIVIAQKCLVQTAHLDAFRYDHF